MGLGEHCEHPQRGEYTLHKELRTKHTKIYTITITIPFHKVHGFQLSATYNTLC